MSTFTDLRLVFRQGLDVAFSKESRQRVWDMPLYSNSIYLMLNAALGAVFGLVFWVVAARLYPTDVVGQGSAVVSVAGFLTFVAGLGLAIGLIRFLPDAGKNATALINSCFTISGITAVAASVVFLVGIPLWSPALHFVRDNPVFLIAFVVFVTAAALFGVLDGVFIGLRRAKFTLAKNVILNILRVALAIAMASFFGVFGVFASWGVAVSASLLFGMVLLLTMLPGYRPTPTLRRQVSTDMLHFSFANYISTGLWSIPGWLFPVMVLNQLGEDANAYFFVSWAMGSLLFAIPSAISTSLLVEGSHQESSLSQDVTRSVKLTMLLLLPAMAVMIFAGHWVLFLFGSDYSQEGTKLLWLLAVSALPMAVNSVYLSIARVRKSLKDVILVAAAIGVGTFVLGYLLISPLGILGPALGWLIAHTLTALAALVRARKLLRDEPRIESNAVDPPAPALASAGKAGSISPNDSIAAAPRAPEMKATAEKENAQAAE